MYYSHSQLKEPADETPLWRYMDLTKFLSLLESRSIHLTPLINFDDPFEGHPTRPVIDALTVFPKNASQKEIEEKCKIAENNITAFQNGRRLVSASCWHSNPTESAAMWAQYLRTGEGFAIQTSFEKLKQSCSADPKKVTGAIVQYVDFDSYVPADDNILIWAALKRTSFEHEREFRLLYLNDHFLPDGSKIEVDLNILIQSIYIAPTTPKWIFELAKNVLSRYSIEAEVQHSTLLDSPNYYRIPE